MRELYERLAVLVMYIRFQVGVMKMLESFGLDWKDKRRKAEKLFARVDGITGASTAKLIDEVNIAFNLLVTLRTIEVSFMKGPELRLFLDARYSRFFGDAPMVERDAAVLIDDFVDGLVTDSSLTELRGILEDLVPKLDAIAEMQKRSRQATLGAIARKASRPKVVRREQKPALEAFFRKFIEPHVGVVYELPLGR